MGRDLDDSFLLSCDEDGIDCRARFTEDGYLEVWQGHEDGPNWAFSPEEVAVLARELVRRFPLDALGGV